MNRTQLGRAADLESKGANVAANRLIAEGILRLVGKGTHQQVEVNAEHPLAAAIVALFRRERELGEEFLEEISRVLRQHAPVLIGAWIEGPLAEGTDAPGSPVLLGVLGESRTLSNVTRQLRSELTSIEAKYDRTVEIIGRTRPDLEAATPAERRRLARIVQLFGLPPAAFEDSHGTWKRLRDYALHADKDRQLLLVSHAIADKITHDPGALKDAVRRVAKRLTTASKREQETLKEWLTILETMSPMRLKRFLVDEGERATRLRQSLPFFDILTEEDREKLLRTSRDT